MAKATITGGTLFDNYFRSSLSVSSLVVFVERKTGLDELVYTQGESREPLGTVPFCGGTLFSSRRLAQEVWRHDILGAAKLPQAVGFSFWRMWDASKHINSAGSLAKRFWPQR